VYERLLSVKANATRFLLFQCMAFYLRKKRVDPETTTPLVSGHANRERHDHGIERQDHHNNWGK